MNREMRSVLAWLIVCLSAACVVPALEPAAIAQTEEVKFKTLEGDIAEIFKTRQELNKRASQVRSILGGTSQLSGSETAFDEFYQKYLFPSWTLTDEESLGSLAKDRDRFINSDLARSTQGVHDRLVELAFAKMSEIAQDQEFHPGVRYNAVLILGALNSREPDRISKVNPEPLPKALDVLLGLFRNADESDAVRVAALLGILRHLEWDDFRQAGQMAADKKAGIVADLIALAQQNTPPENRSADGHTWIRRRALEGLFYGSQGGPSLDVAAVFEKLIADDQEPLALRCTAADIMGRLAYKAPVVPAAEPNAKELGHLAVVACATELSRLEEQQKLAGMRSPTPYGAVGGMGMPGGMGGMPGGMSNMGDMMKGMGTKPGSPGMSSSMMDAMKGMAGGGKKKGPKSKAKPADLLGQATTPQASQAKPEDPKDLRLEHARRRLRAWLYSVQIGLGDEKANPANEVRRTGFGANAKFEEKWERGVIAFAQAEPQSVYVKDVIAKNRNLISIVEAPDLDFDTFVEDLQEEMKAMEAISRPLKAPAATEPAASEPAVDAVPGVPAEPVPATAEPAAALPPEVPAAAETPALGAK